MAINHHMLSSARSDRLNSAELKSLRRLQENLIRKGVRRTSTTIPAWAFTSTLARTGFGLMMVASVIAINGYYNSYSSYSNSRSVGPTETSCCSIAYAEVDDAATIAARAVAGRGPASGFFADTRLTREVALVGQMDNGLNIYSFRYLWDDQTWVGLVAEDLMARDDLKGAVLTLANGINGIDYKSLGLRIATLEEWRSANLAALRADFVGSKRSKPREPAKLYNRIPAMVNAGHAVETGSLP
jgi:hypothetical protein